MSPRLFFALLGTGLSIASAALLVYFFQYRNQLPSGPCISVVENGHFIDDAFEPYRFSGSLTFWPQAQAITAFGTATSDGKQLHLRRQMKLELLRRTGNRLVYLISALHVDPVDQVMQHDVFFTDPGQKLFISIKKLGANEYMYFVNDSWIFMCRVR